MAGGTTQYGRAKYPAAASPDSRTHTHTHAREYKGKKMARARNRCTYVRRHNELRYGGKQLCAARRHTDRGDAARPVAAATYSYAAHATTMFFPYVIAASRPPIRFSRATRAADSSRPVFRHEISRKTRKNRLSVRLLLSSGRAPVRWWGRTPGKRHDKRLPPGSDGDGTGNERRYRYRRGNRRPERASYTYVCVHCTRR